MHRDDIRNIAIIAHVDHGKTTLVDCLLTQSGTIEGHKTLQDRAWISWTRNGRGITILSKNTAINGKTEPSTSLILRALRLWGRS